MSCSVNRQEYEQLDFDDEGSFTKAHLSFYEPELRSLYESLDEDLHQIYENPSKIPKRESLNRNGLLHSNLKNDESMMSIESPSSPVRKKLEPNAW